MNYASSKEAAERVVSEITGNGGRAIAVQGDVAKSADVKRIFAETKKAFGAARCSGKQRGCISVCARSKR